MLHTPPKNFIDLFSRARAAANTIEIESHEDGGGVGFTAPTRVNGRFYVALATKWSFGRICMLRVSLNSRRRLCDEHFQSPECGVHLH